MNVTDIKKNLKLIDWPIIILLLVFMCTSILFLAQTTANPFDGSEEGWSAIYEKLDLFYPRQQLMWFLTGFVWIAILCAMNYHTLAKMTKVGLLVVVLALIAVLFSEQRNGISGWFFIGSFGIQPAEYTKLLVILITAKFASAQVEKNDRIVLGVDFLKTAGVIALLVFLLMLQPDTGTAMVYLMIFVGVLFAGRVRWRVIFTVLAVVLVVFVLLFFMGLLPHYISMRVLIFFGMDNPETLEILNIPVNQLNMYDSAQQDTAAMAIASGGLTGKGFFTPGSIVQLDYLSEAHNDFIFAASIEAAGFLGGAFIILLYLLLLGRCMFLAYRARDTLGYFIIIGVVSMQIAHIFENIGMNIGIMPVTGIPLPFISYGGSNLWTNMMAMGLVLMVNMRRPTKRYQSSMETGVG